MARFLCFNAHSHSQKTKRASHVPSGSMKKTLEDNPQNQLSTNIIITTGVNSTHGRGHGDALLNANGMLVAGSIQRSWKSEEIKCDFNVLSNMELHQARNLRKSCSLGNVSAQKGGDSFKNDIEIVIDQLSSDMVNNVSTASIGDPQNSDNEFPKDSDPQLSTENNGSSGEFTHHTQAAVAKSCSMPNFSAVTQNPVTSLEHCYGSSEDLHALETRERGDLVLKVGSEVDKEKDDVTCSVELNNLETIVEDGLESCNRVGSETVAEDGFQSYNYTGTAKDWVVPVMDVTNEIKREFSDEQYDGSPSLEFKIKRIEEWVTNLPHCSSLEETDTLLHDTDHVNKVSDVDDLMARKLEGKVSPGMEAAKKYTSSLPAAAHAAQMANLGLVVIPFLSAFISLRVLNLSGNTIVRITAGALPRGLHVLNLSRNCISTIEGLRELTRLRILDLSYNRILRIGHGLASCSSLKELYLAGNKVSEVEGLHRLLKLNILDLRFNKFSTAKCLGQLAANYSSMQAISLEGNPAQKNVGDEQLRKQLQGLLPHLAYYNRQPIKASSLKDAVDRSARYQLDRALRSEHRPSRKGAGHRASSSGHGRKSQAMVSPKRVRGRHGAGRGAAQPQCVEIGNGSSVGGKADVSMRRSRSEGTLGAM